MNQFDPLPILYTDRLILRQVTKDDADDLFVIRSDKDVMQYIPRPLATKPEDVYPLIEMIEDFRIKGEKANWGIALKENNQLIGMIGYVRVQPEHFRAEIGYSLAKAFHRQGIMLEALKRMIEYGFSEMNLHSIEAIIDAENIASGSLLEKAGFRKEAYFREDFCYNNIFRNSIHYGLLRSDLK